MTTPQPKTKAKELIEIVNNAVSDASLSEFQYQRCRRLLSSIRGECPLDWVLTIEATIEMYANNPVQSLRIATEVLDISQSVTSLRNIYFIFINCQALGRANETIERIVEMCQKQNIDPVCYLPKNFKVLSYFLTGSVDEAAFEAFAGDLEHSYDYAELKMASENLGLCNIAMKKISDIVERCFSDFSVRCRKFEYSYIHDEFLTMLYIDESFETIRELNSEIFSRCYDNGLHEELLKISYFVLPFDKEVHNHAG